MGVDERWIDLIDPSPDELRAHLPETLHPAALELLLKPHVHDDSLARGSSRTTRM